MTEKDDFRDKLEELLPDGGMLMELEPLLKSGEREGLIHPVSCIEAIRSSFKDFKDKGTEESFFASWNIVDHIFSCEKRACFTLRTPVHMTKYRYPTDQEYEELKAHIRNAFVFDRFDEFVHSEIKGLETEEEQTRRRQELEVHRDKSFEQARRWFDKLLGEDEAN